jgi:hypothetical protein
MYVYIFNEVQASLYMVGFYHVDGLFEHESNYENKEDAASRVNFLNGGQDEFFRDDDRRDKFARSAMQTLMMTLPNHGEDVIAGMAYKQAEAMMIERMKHEHI